jgi:RNA polymerase sigma-70 factor (ECF subfamily)
MDDAAAMHLNRSSAAERTASASEAVVNLARRYTGGLMLFGRRNSRDAFERQAERVFPSVFGTALRLTRSREDAEDLAQEAIVRAFDAYDRFDGTNFKAWILRIVTNLYINRYRQKQRGPQMGSLEDDGVYEPMADEAWVPDRQVFDEMVGEEVEEALGRVPEDFRLAVILSDIEGMSYQEIADVMDVPIGTVRSRLARGRAMLRKQLLGYAKQHGYVKDEDLSETL